MNDTPRCPTCGSDRWKTTTVTETEYAEILFSAGSGWIRRGESEAVLDTRLIYLACDNDHAVQPGDLFSQLSSAWASADYTEEG